QRASGPAITLSSSAASPTVRTIGPETLSVDQALVIPGSGTRPGASRMPTTPQKAAGLRSDPPMSVPSASGVMWQARLTAEPPLLPPQALLASDGVFVT